MRSAAPSCRCAMLAVCVLAFMQTHVHYTLDLTGSFPTAFAACAVFEVVALGIAALTRDTGRRVAAGRAPS